MTRHTLSLNDANWHFGQVSPRPFTDPDVYDLPAVAEWLPATVPGNVHTDLLALGRIPDPFFGEQYKESFWVEDVDWWYRCVIEPPHENDTMRQRREDVNISSSLFLPESRAFLIFEGIDYLSAIFINSQETARHEGMFSRQSVEITEALRRGPVEVAVRLWGSAALPRRRLSWPQRLWQKLAGLLYRSWVGIYSDRTATLKCQMSFGWDFAPPLRPMGIWAEVNLVITGPVFINGQWSIANSQLSIIDNCSEPKPPSGLTTAHCSPLTDNCTLTVHCTLDSVQPRQVQAQLHLSPANFEGADFGPFHDNLNLPAGRSEHHLTCQLSQVSLWQPWDRGQPHLYHVRLSLLDSTGEPLDEVITRTGLRTVELQNWQFRLNGQPYFMRGLNWVPADCFPGRLRRDDYTRLLTLARESGANLLRVWGGGLREKQAFYDLCDELGLLVWQEFPFACEFLGSYPRDPAYLKLVKAECGDIVHQLRHHPALILWCGGNEFSRSRNRPLLDTLAAAVQQHDGTRPFIPVSPAPGDSHNWAVWHGYQPIQSYQNEEARFLSEFGLQALPHLNTLTAALPDPATGWQTHHANLAKLTHYTSLFNYHLPITLDNLQFTIHNSQLVQAAALQTAIEHMRRRKRETGGVCVWQFNEPWPAISWAIVDYFGRPKLAYERLKWWYHPILISLKFPVGRRWQAGDTFTAEIWAINDSLDCLPGCELEVTLETTAPQGRPQTADRGPGRFEQHLIHSQRFDLAANSAQKVGMLAHRFPSTSSPLAALRAFAERILFCGVRPSGPGVLGTGHSLASPRCLTLTLHRQGQLIAQNRYDLDWWDESPGRWQLRVRRWLAEWALR